MYLLRLLIFAAGAWLIYRLLFAPVLKKRRQSSAQASSDSSEMVQCQFCQLHVPQQEAVSHRELWFCCKDHKEKFLENEHPQ